MIQATGAASTFSKTWTMVGVSPSGFRTEVEVGSTLLANEVGQE